MRGAYTPLYASPQQAAGGEPDPRDDVHALGIIWYQLVTGDLSLTRIPPDWQAIVDERGLEKDHLRLLVSCIASRVEKRLPSAVALAEQLGELFKLKPVQSIARQESPREASTSAEEVTGLLKPALVPSIVPQEPPHEAVALAEQLIGLTKSRPSQMSRGKCYLRCARPSCSPRCLPNEMSRTILSLG